jgi:hypothetical protein
MAIARLPLDTVEQRAARRIATDRLRRGSNSIDRAARWRPLDREPLVLDQEPSVLDREPLVLDREPLGQAADRFPGVASSSIAGQ